MSTINELLELASDKKAVEFTSLFEDIIKEKAILALEAKRLSLAESLYSDPDEEQMPEINDEEDFDVDLDDLDLDDEGFKSEDE